MAYGLKYTSEFDSFKKLQSYSVNIFQKDYVGDPITVLLSGTPVVQEWQEDDAKAPIRGCTLKVSILTDELGVRLVDFYSEDDAGFYVELRCTTTDQYLFKGYLLQDDCSEMQVDFNHEISLTFTDMLGTLKDITINEAAVIVGDLHTESGVDFYNPTPVANLTICSFDSRVGVLKPGDTFTLFDGINTYNLTCYNINYNIALGWVININEVCPFAGTVTFDFTYKIPYQLEGYIPLIDVLKLCLKSTLLDIRLKSVVSIYPEGGTNESVWDDTFIDANTLRVDTNSWMNCYDILEQLMNRFNASLFQANAIWNIVRWDEMYRYTTFQGATMYGSNYDNNFTLYSTGAIQSETFTFMDGYDLETGVMKSIERPYQFVKETFNYVQPDDLLCNTNLTDLGDLLTEYTTGLFIFREYGLNKWYNGPFSPIPKRFIRIVIDNDPTSDKYTQEIERYAVVYDATGSADKSVKSCDIPLSERDSIDYRFSFRTSNSQPGNVNVNFAITITNGISTLYLHANGQWLSTVGFTYNIPAGDNTNEWHDVSIKSNGVPFNGNLNIYLAEATSNGGTPSTDETHYNNLDLIVNYVINGSGKVIGHTHTDSQIENIKNNNSKDIYLDNTPSNSIKGSLFTANYNGVLRARATIWKYPGVVIDPVANLGTATTQESLFTRFKPRAKYEGNLLKVLQGAGPYEFITPLSMFKHFKFQDEYRFVPGKMAIDYKNANVNLTLYELIDRMGYNFNGGLTAAYLEWVESKIYEFNYLYENK